MWAFLGRLIVIRLLLTQRCVQSGLRMFVAARTLRLLRAEDGRRTGTVTVLLLTLLLSVRRGTLLAVHATRVSLTSLPRSLRSLTDVKPTAPVTVLLLKLTAVGVNGLTVPVTRMRLTCWRTLRCGLRG
jgi:hypothetical protein